MRTALITGGSQGLGRALSQALAHDGWNLIVDARGAAGLDDLAGLLPHRNRINVIAGDIGDPDHRAALVAAVARAGELHLLVNNASTLGPTPLPPLRTTDSDQIYAVFRVNTFAPIELSTALLPWLSRSTGTVIDISSDAAVEHYEGWGLYGASKAALDHLTLTLAAENPGIHWYAIDPGDMRTSMQQLAFPGEDIADRPVPEEVVPAFLRLLETAPPSGRYRAAHLLQHGANLVVHR